jgi:hypothetical protein
MLIPLMRTLTIWISAYSTPKTSSWDESRLLGGKTECDGSNSNHLRNCLGGPVFPPPL